MPLAISIDHGVIGASASSTTCMHVVVAGNDVFARVVDHMILRH